MYRSARPAYQASTRPRDTATTGALRGPNRARIQAMNGRQWSSSTVTLER